MTDAINGAAHEICPEQRMSAPTIETVSWILSPAQAQRSVDSQIDRQGGRRSNLYCNIGLRNLQESFDACRLRTLEAAEHLASAEGSLAHASARDEPNEET